MEFHWRLILLRLLQSDLEGTDSEMMKPLQPCEDCPQPELEICIRTCPKLQSRGDG